MRINKNIKIDDSETKLENLMNYLSVGSIYVSTKNENPSKNLGGTWELCDKEYRSEAGSYTMKSSEMTNLSAGTIYYERSGHSVRLRFDITTNIELNDSSIELFKIDFSNFGFKRLNFAFNGFASGSDSQNAIIICNISIDGICSSVDVVPKGTATTVATGASPRINITIPVQFSDMIDEFCDKFYWQRTK